MKMSAVLNPPLMSFSPNVIPRSLFALSPSGRQLSIIVANYPTHRVDCQNNSRIITNWQQEQKWYSVIIIPWSLVIVCSQPKHPVGKHRCCQLPDTQSRLPKDLKNNNKLATRTKNIARIANAVHCHSLLKAHYEC